MGNDGSTDGSIMVMGARGAGVPCTWCRGGVHVVQGYPARGAGVSIPTGVHVVQGCMVKMLELPPL
jgi:hypothetical protein